MEAFQLSLWMVFFAEMGDKTQLVALCLATRFNARVVLSGVFAATLVVHIISVLLGGCVGKLLPPSWVQLMAGLAFVGFGLWTLRGDELDDDSCGSKQGRSPFWIVATTFFLAELGDKTMLSTVTLATHGNIWLVWIGSSLGMVLSDGLAIFVGRKLGKQLPERAVKIGAAMIFFAFGAVSLTQGARQIGLVGWATSAAVLAVFAFLFVYSSRRERIAAARAVVDSEPAETLPEEELVGRR